MSGYHGWTHRPKAQGGTDPVEISTTRTKFRAYRFADLSVSATMLDLIWADDWENEDDTVFGARTSAGVTATGTDDVKFIDVLVPGRVMVTIGVYFATTFNGSVGVMLQDQNPVVGGTPYEMVHGPNLYDVGGATSLNLTGYKLLTYVREYPIYDPFASGSQFPVQMYAQVGQNSGSAKTMTEAFLEVIHEA